MRVIVLGMSCLLFWAPSAWSQLAPEQVGTATLPEPGENWIAGITRMGAYIYDADSGDMQGLISLSGYTSGFEVDRERRRPERRDRDPEAEAETLTDVVERVVGDALGDLVAVQAFDLRGRKGFELDIGGAGILQAHDHAFQHPAGAAVDRRDHAAARRGIADVRIALVLPERLAQPHGVADLDLKAGSQSDVIRAAESDGSNRRAAIDDLFRFA